MDERDELAARFQAQRAHLHGVAYRMLGSAAEADDAVQEAWLRLSRADGVDNLAPWLRTVVSRVCLDVLRARKNRREDPIGRLPDLADPNTPEHDALLVDSVGRALLVLLDTLSPAERVAFVLHDLFAVPFDNIAQTLERSPAAAKKLASRARSRVRGTSEVPVRDLAAHRRVVEAFLRAARDGDIAALLAVLAPDVVRRVDRVELRGARRVVKETAVFGRRARFAEVALVNGRVGAVVAPHGRLLLALAITVEGIASPATRWSPTWSGYPSVS
ncbi:RNA polymerase sigma-70 factor, ECF subfamily [Allokutzneria albata]|uniref:RNA polymerase sigma-70 factor, ECF subfamily n=1 Tax=Allokutzneria albata TaxID=211114 RepID=A0A1G9UWW4_ALLAB|nr:RNA polymerase sigma-70 factor, ECF subfamily [Allokutzneria albata]